MPSPYAAPNYSSYGGRPTPFRLTGKKGRDENAMTASLGTSYGNAQAHGDQIDALLGDYFGDPTGGAGAFQDYFAKAAEANAAPALRKFNDSIGGVSASIASRFGGNASSEESRVVRGTADDFSRNLTESIARTGPQAVAAGQNRGGQLMSASNSYASRGLDTAQLIQQALARKKPSPWGKILGTAAGVGASFIPGVGSVAGPAILGATR